jgi:hypothetical protein
MSRRTPESPNNPSSEWLKKKLEELRRNLRETGLWPETGDRLLADLSHLINAPDPASSEEDLEMLSIVVNDALAGIDIMKKYPAFYARMLVDEELRTAFLDTLELLEESEDDELPEEVKSESFDLEIIKKVMSRPIIIEAAKDKLKLVWRRSAEQLQAMLYINTLKPQELLRSGVYLPEGGHINILHSQVEIDGQELDIRLEASHALNNPGYLNLMIAMIAPEQFTRRFEATIAWGSYRESAVINLFGIAKFPPLRTDQVFSPAGDLIHGLDLRLEQLN